METASTRLGEELADLLPRYRLLKPLLGGAALAIAVTVLAFATHASWEDRWLYATRWTARASLLLFAGAYLLRSIPRSRASGLAFAGTHFVHAAAFITYIAAYDVPRGVVSTIGGAIGYAVLIIMVVATFVPVSASAQLRRWGMAYLWLVFMSSYLGRLVENGDRVGEGAFGVLVLLAILIARLFRARQRTASSIQMRRRST